MNNARACRCAGMGGLLSFFWGAGPESAGLDVADPATGLTPRQKRYVTDTWALVKKDLRGSGIAVLHTFFTDFPEYTKYFNAFKDVPIKDLPTNKKFQAHSHSVIYALSSVVDNLDDTGVLVEMLNKLGENHGRRNITPKQFQDLKGVILKVLKAKLGKVMTPDAEEAWSKTLDVAYSIIFKGMENVKKNDHIIS
ncbi:Uncharacterized protein GBIM_11438 [Gryllus bimaculatus]|nr:Uncharacterized protein GBIM_11438 [Gryllus bimaculatus]